MPVERLSRTTTSTRGYGPPTRAANTHAALRGGLAGGVSFLAAELALAQLTHIGGDPLDVLQRAAAIALGAHALNEATPLFYVLAGALFVHALLATVYAVFLAALLDRAARVPAWVVAPVFGALVYVLNYFVFTARFPWFITERGPFTLTLHVLFALVVAGVYRGAK